MASSRMNYQCDDNNTKGITYLEILCHIVKGGINENCF